MIEIFSQPTFHKTLVILALIGAELAGGGVQILPPLPVRVFLDPIPGRGLSVLQSGYLVFSIFFPNFDPQNSKLRFFQK